MNSAQRDDSVVMRVVGAHKRYSHSPERARRPGVKEVIRAMLGLAPGPHSGRLREDEFWAVRDVTFTLNRGEALGIVGLNGAGKSTLLKMILGRLRPDAGSIWAIRWGALSRNRSTSSCSILAPSDAGMSRKAESVA